MPDVVTFDPINLRIVEIDAGGDNVLQLNEIYSEWQQWLVDDPSRLGYPQAFDVRGGDPTSPSENLGFTYFLINDWKIRPAESSHKLTIVGNLRPEGGIGSVFVPTLGAFTVNTETQFTNLIDGVSALTTRIESLENTVSTQMADQITALWRNFGLDPANPLEVTATQRKAGAVMTVTITGLGTDTVTATRTV